MSFVSRMAEDLADLQDINKKLTEENLRLKRAVLNQCGDNLCFLTDKEIGDIRADPGRIPPWPEFGESCRRFHAQVADAVGGVLQAGQMTIAQLEAEVERLRQENANYDRHAQDRANEHARELERLREALEFIAETKEATINVAAKMGLQQCVARARCALKGESWPQ
jgi:hypothetical protein